ncbi:MAG: hypothetical protein SFT81_07325 [Candidatus Caenarcaniphilales bacterium]|nr:hypothetical protein [Candidatus Caenarcaniphilales bacterium]
MRKMCVRLDGKLTRRGSYTGGNAVRSARFRNRSARGSGIFNRGTYRDSLSYEIFDTLTSFATTLGGDVRIKRKAHFNALVAEDTTLNFYTVKKKQVEEALPKDSVDPQDPENPKLNQKAEPVFKT